LQLLSALKNNEVDFNNLFNDKIMKIIETLLENNINFFLKDFSNFFNRLYTDLIGFIKTSLFELFYNINIMNVNVNGNQHENGNEIRYENYLK
jgi:hypothetical protein